MKHDCELSDELLIAARDRGVFQRCLHALGLESVESDKSLSGARRTGLYGCDNMEREGGQEASESSYDKQDIGRLNVLTTAHSG